MGTQKETTEALLIAPLRKVALAEINDSEESGDHAVYRPEPVS